MGNPFDCHPLAHSTQKQAVFKRFSVCEPFTQNMEGQPVISWIPVVMHPGSKLPSDEDRGTEKAYAHALSSVAAGHPVGPRGQATPTAPSKAYYYPVPMQYPTGSVGPSGGPGMMFMHASGGLVVPNGLGFLPPPPPVPPSFAPLSDSSTSTATLVDSYSHSHSLSHSTNSHSVHTHYMNNVCESEPLNETLKRHSASLSASRATSSRMIRPSTNNRRASAHISAASLARRKAVSFDTEDTILEIKSSLDELHAIPVNSVESLPRSSSTVSNHKLRKPKQSSMKHRSSSSNSRALSGSSLARRISSGSSIMKHRAGSSGSTLSHRAGSGSSLAVRANSGSSIRKRASITSLAHLHYRHDYSNRSALQPSFSYQPFYLQEASEENEVSGNSNLYADLDGTDPFSMSRAGTGMRERSSAGISGSSARKRRSRVIRLPSPPTSPSPPPKPVIKREPSKTVMSLHKSTSNFRISFTQAKRAPTKETWLTSTHSGAPSLFQKWARKLQPPPASVVMSTALRPEVPASGSPLTPAIPAELPPQVPGELSLSRRAPRASKPLPALPDVPECTLGLSRGEADECARAATRGEDSDGGISQSGSEDTAVGKEGTELIRSIQGGAVTEAVVHGIECTVLPVSQRGHDPDWRVDTPVEKEQNDKLKMKERKLNTMLSKISLRTKNAELALKEVLLDVSVGSKSFKWWWK
ncbi:hypothetical protein BC830DRAFT_927200 [Chytriomyces sp. MP71]|nr:hypothetical protein BC830DRAFT_927200 [Chytriomyces sp. MP71]